MNRTTRVHSKKTPASAVEDTTTQGAPDVARDEKAPPDNGRDALQRDLQRAELRYGLLAEHAPDLIYSLDDAGNILEINPAVSAFGYDPADLVGRPYGDLIHPDDRSRVVGSCYQMVAARTDASKSSQYRIVTPLKQVHWLEDNCTVRFDVQGGLLLLQGICRDITATISGGQHMLAAGRSLDDQMRIRAVELMFANEELQKEILERRKTEQELRERGADLEIEMSTVQEANTALKVLFKRREADKHAFEDQVMINVKELLLPYLDKLKAMADDERQQAYLSILESNLNEITEPFLRRISMVYFDLTPTEIKVANFIRQGKSSRDIASLLGLSIRTIESYRFSIRRKLRLQGKKINLRTFLQAIR